MVTASSATDYCPACGDQLDPILGGYRLNVATFDIMTSAVGGGGGPQKVDKRTKSADLWQWQGGGGKKIWTFCGGHRRTGLGWIRIRVFCCQPNSALANGNLAEVARVLGDMMEHPNSSQPNLGLGAGESPCTCNRIRSLDYDQSWESRREG